jgi:mRNA-degrading endonuclease RelE of RelBE toxin-antitoxin system
LNAVSPAQQIYSREFDKIFFNLPPHIRVHIESKIDEIGSRLAQFPHHRLKGGDDFRLRVGDYRVIYQFDLNRNIVFLITLGNRCEIYR